LEHITEFFGREAGVERFNERGCPGYVRCGGGGSPHEREIYFIARYSRKYMASGGGYVDFLPEVGILTFKYKTLPCGRNGNRFRICGREVRIASQLIPRRANNQNTFTDGVLYGFVFERVITAVERPPQAHINNIRAVFDGVINPAQNRIAVEHALHRFTGVDYKEHCVRCDADVIPACNYTGNECTVTGGVIINVLKTDFMLS
jgi:hypothetical protein